MGRGLHNPPGVTLLSRPAGVRAHKPHYRSRKPPGGRREGQGCHAPGQRNTSTGAKGSLPKRRTTA
nr:MAG TPA: hypothetical protein [Caudoviricetes sp.]